MMQSAEALRQEVEAQTQELESLREEMTAAEAHRTEELEETVARYSHHHFGAQCAAE